MRIAEIDHSSDCFPDFNCQDSLQISRSMVVERRFGHAIFLRTFAASSEGNRASPRGSLRCHSVWFPSSRTRSPNSSRTQNSHFKRSKTAAKRRCLARRYSASSIEKLKISAVASGQNHLANIAIPVMTKAHPDRLPAIDENSEESTRQAPLQ